jgi:hypothetical protein
LPVGYCLPENTLTNSSDAGEPLFPDSVEAMRLVRGYMEAFGLNQDELLYGVHAESGAGRRIRTQLVEDRESRMEDGGETGGGGIDLRSSIIDPRPKPHHPRSSILHLRP